MPVTQDKPAPYAPSSTVLEVINRYRDRGLPKPIDGDVLTRAGISQTVIPRTLQALQLLDLIDAEGVPTDTFESIRKAPEVEYQQRLREWLNSAYADVIQYVDPQTDDETKVRDAFRSYNPVGQQSRMVSLFMNLYAAAGVRSTAAPKASAPRAPRATPPAVNRVKSTVRKPLGNKNSGMSGELPPALTGLLSDLPQNGEGWTQARRDKFMGAFAVMLDYSFPIVENEQASEVNEEDAA